jgi:tetratricopeptide (TPR) repeat protein
VRVRLVLFASLASTVLAGSASASSAADELVREARVHEAAHKDELALRRYSEALALDPTLEEAYMGLGELRARRGDAREAERVYSVALEHIPTLRIALAGRARARWALGLHDDAQSDMFTYATQAGDTRALKELAGWYGEDGKAPAQLATWRRILSTAERAGDEKLLREAKVTVRALQIMVGPADPVSAPVDEGEVRRGVARVARRGG